MNYPIKYAARLRNSLSFLALAAFIFIGNHTATAQGLAQDPSQALAQDKPHPRFAYDLGAQVRFDNREYAACDNWEPSCTLFGIRADVAIGLKLEQNNCSHRILGGTSALYQFGGEAKAQLLLYYKLQTELKHSQFGILAGAFNRNESRAYYSPAFYSSQDLFLDNTYDGIQFNWERKDRFYFELGVDWKGMISENKPERREEFQVYSGGKYNFKPWCSLGYSVLMHHYACSKLANNVVDDIKGNPYLELDFGNMVNMQSLMLRAGILVGYEWDRAAGGKPVLPVNGNLFFRVKKWNVSIDNEVFFGHDPMPLYNAIAPEGEPYADKLYMGESLLRHRNGENFGYWDRLSLAWGGSRIIKVSNLAFQLRVNIDFNAGFVGSQQIIQISYKF